MGLFLGWPIHRARGAPEEAPALGQRQAGAACFPRQSIQRADIWLPSGPSLGLSRRFCTSSLPPVEVSVSLTGLQAAEPSRAAAVQLLQLLHLFQDWPLKFPQPLATVPGSGRGTLNPLDSQRRGLAWEQCCWEVQCRDHCRHPPASGQDPIPEKPVPHSSVAVRILPCVSAKSFCLQF